jgi:hypothetical protein
MHATQPCLQGHLHRQLLLLLLLLACALSQVSHQLLE